MSALEIVEDTPSDPEDKNWRKGDLEKDERKSKLEAAFSGIIQHLSTLAQQQVNDRTTIEQRWLSDLRQYHGIYEAAIEGALKNDSERSRAFINYTRPKTTAWQARLFDLLFPADDKNWGINPTPVPELTDGAKDALRLADEADEKAAQAVDQNNAMVDEGAPPEDRAPVLAQAEQAGAFAKAQRGFGEELQKHMDKARRCAELMEREIHDHLVECNYPAKSREVINDACKIGIGVLKGPVVASKKPRSWQKGEEGYNLDRDDSPRMAYRKVNPWNFFPDMSATSMDDAEFTFERHLPNKSKLRRMTKELGFDKDIVRDLLRQGPGYASNTDLNHLTELRSLQGDDNSSDNVAVKGRYIVWEYHGPLENEQVSTILWGMGKYADAKRMDEEDDPLEERMIVAYFCEGRMLKIAPYYPMDSGDKIYSVFSFEKAEASIFGAVGIPRLMRNEQAMLNSAVRMMIDNGALSVGPQIIIDKTQVEPENGKWEFAPRKVWIKKGQEIANNSPFETKNIPSNQAQIQGIIELALRFIDDVISMPMIAQGDQGQATNTMGGMSMLFNSANVVFRRVVKNWDDDITDGSITRAYDWQMQFSDKDDIKGDMQTEARGTSVLLVREVQSQQLMAIAMQWSQHPIIGPAVRVYEALSMTLQAMAINPGDLLVGKDEFEERLKAMSESGAEEVNPDQIRAEASIQVAQITSETRMAETNLNREIAGMNRETEIMKLVSKEGVDMSRIEAMLEKTRADNDSGERKMAAEIGVEKQLASEARAAGREPTGSGGAISAGTTETIK